MDKNEIEKRLDEVIEMSKNIDFSYGKLSSEQKQQYLDKINSILKLDPLNRDALYWKALFYQCIEDFDNAIALYEQILQINPNDKDAKDALKDCKEFRGWKIEKENRQSNTSNYSTNYAAKNESSDLLEKVPCELILALKFVVIIIILFTCFQPLIFSGNDKKVMKAADSYETTVQQTQPEQQTRQPVRETAPVSGNLIQLKVNSVSEYNFLTKQEIYDIRKKYVKESLFASANYEPDTGVFGGIVDKKPWWNTTPCNQLNYKGDYHEHIEGKSKVSAQINNPNALVGISLPYAPWFLDDNKEFCYDEYGKFIPASMYYDRENNLIIAKYKVTEKFTEYRTRINSTTTRIPLQLSGLNAIDFGYRYVYAFDTKNIKMFNKDSSNVTDDVKTFTDYIHLGGSCKYEGGCNNISPMQNDKMIKVYELPAEINLKLWKKQPANKYMKADMYYRIIFEE